MGFEEEYQSFLNEHLQLRSGERQRRLKEGLGQAEMTFLKNVWWPLFHHFQYLHPEYEVQDFKDGKRYLDFAYIRSGVRMCIEIDAYGPHVKNISRWQFSDELMRQNHLVIDEWKVIRFSYDQVLEKPRQCEQTLQQAMGRLLGNEWEHLSLTCIEKEVLRFALNKEGPIFPKEMYALLDLTDKTVKKILTKLVEKKILVPTSGKQRVHSYVLSEGIKSPFFNRRISD